MHAHLPSASILLFFLATMGGSSTFDLGPAFARFELRFAPSISYFPNYLDERIAHCDFDRCDWGLDLDQSAN